MRKILFAALLAIGFTACDKNESPVIEIHELGYENTATVAQGGDLHIDAEIVAEHKISTIRLTIHPEGESVSIVQATDEEHTWEVDSVYNTKYAGVKNTDFHEHVEVPAAAPAGFYHLHIILTDMAGNQTTEEAEIEVLTAK